MKMGSKHLNQTRTFAARNRAHLCSESGQSLMEFALLTPLLAVLLLGVVDMGRYAYISILVGNAARAGVAYGTQTHITAHDTAGIIAAADNDFQNNGQSVSNLNVSSAYACGCDNGGTITVLLGCTTGSCPIGQHEVVSLQVTASGTFNALFGYPGIPKSISVSRTATMRVGQ